MDDRSGILLTFTIYSLATSVMQCFIWQALAFRRVWLGKQVLNGQWVVKWQAKGENSIFPPGFPFATIIGPLTHYTLSADCGLKTLLAMRKTAPILFSLLSDNGSTKAEM